MSREKEILLNILTSDNPSGDLEILDKNGLLDILLPELSALKGVDVVDGQKHKDNFIHTLQVVKQAREVSNDPWFIFVAIFHDIGKAKAKRFIKNIGWTFHGHEEISSVMIDDIFNRFELDKSEYNRVKELIFWHGHPKNLSIESNDTSLRRFALDIGSYLEDMLLFCKCDITTRFSDKRERYCNNIDLIYKRILEIKEEDKVREYQIPVTGEVIMKDFGIKPSKLLGDIKTAAKDKVLSGDIGGDYDSVYLFIKNYIENVNRA